MTVQIPTPPPIQPQQVNPFTARPVEVREPAARTVTRSAVSSSREAQENREDRNNRAETTENNRRADESRQVRAATRGGRGANVDIEA
jgi:hypothetical protein